MKRPIDTYAAWTQGTVYLSPRVLDELPRGMARLLRCAVREGGVPLTVRSLDEAGTWLAACFGEVEAARPDAYAWEATATGVTLWCTTDRSRLYALASLALHTGAEGLACGAVYSVPLCDFRAIKIYVPARKHLPFFEELMMLCATLGYNTCVMEVGGAMQYERHPEINEGWEEYCENFREYNGKTLDATKVPPFMHNSIHCENGGGSYLTKDELRELCRTAARYGVEIIPEQPLLSHSDYLLVRHKELAEMPDDPIPCCYCPSNPDVYKLTLDLLDELIEVFEPRTVHIAHDEWWIHGRCPRCRTKDPARMFADDVRIYRDYLAERGIRTMIWGDALVDCFGVDGEKHPGAGLQTRCVPTDRTVTLYGKSYPVYKEYWDFHANEAEGGVLIKLDPLFASAEYLPRDVWIMNWYHTLDLRSDSVYEKGGYEHVYGNFTPMSFEGWFRRIGRGVGGASISNWSATERAHMQHRHFFLDMAYTAYMYYDRSYREDTDGRRTAMCASLELLADIRERTEGEHGLTLVYTTPTVIRHPGVWDGMQVDPDRFRIGYVHLTYADGTTERRDIFWGENIGPDVPIEVEAYGKVGEAAYLTRPLSLDGHTYYRTRFVTDRPVTQARVEPLAGHEILVHTQSLS